jgi:hypothetical protein
MDKVKNYKYGIWLVPVELEKYKTEIFKTSHIPHITFICKIPSKQKAFRMFKLLREYTYSLFAVKVNNSAVDLNHISYDVKQDAYCVSNEYECIDNNDNECPNKSSFSWGHNASLTNYNYSNIVYWMKHIQLEYLIQGSISEELHMSIEYDSNKDNMNMRSIDGDDVITLFKMVVADINDDNPEIWSILEEDKE